MKAAATVRPDASGLRLLLLRSAFNEDVVEGLVRGARQSLREMGADEDALVVEGVPGAFELPLAARCAAESGRFDAIVALGAVIRGETDHYEHIARVASAGLAAVARETGVPVGFGVLTVAKEAQARIRAAAGRANKGAEAARAAVAMVHVLRRLRNGATETPRHRGRYRGTEKRGQAKARGRAPGGRKEPAHSRGAQLARGARK